MTRVAEMLTNLESSSQAGLEFVIQVEQTSREYRDHYGDWVNADPENAKVTLQLYAMERMAELTADKFEVFEDLKKHAYALGSLSGRPSEGCRKIAANLWESSEIASPEAARYVGPPSPDRVVSPVLRADTPGGVTSADMVNLVGAVADGFRDAMSTIVERMDRQPRWSDQEGADDDSLYRSDRLQAIMGLDVKMNLPKIKDDDADLDRHDNAFDDAIICYQFGGRKIRDIDVLLLYGESFPEGTTRSHVFENYLRKAKRAKRIPQEAAKVKAAVREELRTYIWETALQRMTRLDREFDTLVQGNMSHADFRALFESKLQDMEENEMDMPTETTLLRKYLQKINPEMRIRILQKEWKVDGPNKPARNPTTYQEVAIATGLVLEEKADIYATGVVGDGFMFLNGVAGPGAPAGGAVKLPMAGGGGGGAGGAKGGGKGGPTVCRYCHAVGTHYASQCPQKAADTMNDTNKPGEVCEFCKSTIHRKHHHLLASQGSGNQGNSGGGGKAQPSQNSGGQKAEQKGKGRDSWQDKGGKAKGKGKSEKGKTNAWDWTPVDQKTRKCKHGSKCWNMLNTGQRPDWHQPQEYQEL